MADQHYRNVAALGEAIRAYLADQDVNGEPDVSSLKAWFLANKDLALDLAFDTDVYFAGTGFLPDAARFPLLIAVYMRHAHLVNERIQRKQDATLALLPTLQELMPS